ncbi:MAG TPA: phage holin family protein, partial [Solirubrobacterales bacterium]|nr:phage holin family protein [Solirubrobacterales bacterium]
MSRVRPVDVAWSAVRWLALWVLIALLFWGLTAVLPSFDVPSFEAVLLTTGLIAVLNALLWPLLIRALLPLTVFTFGLGSLVLNAAIVSLSIKLVDGHAPSFLDALLVAFLLSVALTVLTPALSIDDDARQLRLVRRRARRPRETTDVPGVILFEIDGLAEAVLRRAIHQGDAPTMAHWIERESHRVVRWECDLSSQTGAS